eukprot:3347785-Amphidinium_carterae.1
MVVAGSPTSLRVVSAATISASGVEWLTHDYLFEIAVMGRWVLESFNAKYTPGVDLPENGHPVKSAA